MNKKIVIIGGGIAGLTALNYLNKEGFNPILLEKSSKIGGAIQTKKISGFTVEVGPNTMLLSDKRTEKMIQDLGLKIENASPESNKRYIVKNGKPIPLPMSVIDFIKTPLFSFKTKKKILLEYFNKQKPLNHEESVSEFIIRRFGREILEYAINPFVAGTYAGDPDELSIMHAFPKLYHFENKYGSIFRGLLKEKKDSYSIRRSTISFPGGIDKICKAIMNNFSKQISTNVKVTKISKIENGFSISYSKDNIENRINCDNILCSVPLYALKDISFDDKIKYDLKKINNVKYPPIISTSIGFKSKDIPNKIKGFGILVPKCEKMDILGVLFSSMLFKNRAPKGFTLLTVFMGGTRNPKHIHLNKKDRQKLIHKDLKTLLGIEVKPSFEHEVIWNQSIPQYSIGYGSYKKVFKSIEEQLRGFYFIGNYVNGISIQDTILSSMNIVNSKFKN